MDTTPIMDYRRELFLHKKLQWLFPLAYTTSENNYTYYVQPCMHSGPNVSCNDNL